MLTADSTTGRHLLAWIILNSACRGNFRFSLFQPEFIMSNLLYSNMDLNGPYKSGQLRGSRVTNKPNNKLLLFFAMFKRTASVFWITELNKF